MSDSCAPDRSDLGAHPDPEVSERSAEIPEWFIEFLDDRQTRKPSAHTMKAYRQDFIAIAALATDGQPARFAITDITKETMRSAFSAYAQNHEAASMRRCWSSWNVLCGCNVARRRSRRRNVQRPAGHFVRFVNNWRGLVDH